MSPAPPDSIALFGGTFDPVHQGHLELVALARGKCDLARVIFVPCARSPFKESNTIADAEQRCDMLRLAIAERGWEDWASVSRFEVDREPPSYSWQTAEHFRKTLPGTRLRWIVGGDQWEQLPQWAEPEKLRDWLNFIVVTRRGTRLQPRPDWRATFLEFDHPASATAIRDGHGDPNWLPPSVAAYCRNSGLYGM